VPGVMKPSHARSIRRSPAPVRTHLTLDAGPPRSIARAVALASAVLFGLALLIAPSLARAAGAARFKSNEVQEVSGAWHVFVTIELPRAPSTPHTPMKFVFTHTVAYERSLTDNSKDPVQTRQNLQNQPPTMESLDVDFSNSQGKVFSKTQFDFGLTRARGYEAGEYKVQIRTTDGIDIGAPMSLTLRGDNPVVDRRSITFDAKKPGIKKVGGDNDAGMEKVGGGNASDANKDYVPPSGDVTPAGSAAPFVSPDAFNPTEEEKVKEKPGGCGCAVPGAHGAGTGLAAIAFAAALGAARARRKRGQRQDDA